MPPALDRQELLHDLINSGGVCINPTSDMHAMHTIAPNVPNSQPLFQKSISTFTTLIEKGWEQLGAWEQALCINGFSDPNLKRCSQPGWEHDGIATAVLA